VASIIPFKGVLYDRAIVGDIAQVVAPPYDVIDEAAQRALHARHPHNVIRLELGLDEPGDGPARNKYTRAAAQLQAWLKDGALQRDSRPAVYPYSIEYRAPGSARGEPTRILKGFLATAALEEFGTGRIYPHENTRAAAKEDRLRLLEACRANFSPIFSLFSDPDSRVTRLLEKAFDAQHPRIDFLDDAGFRQRLWSVTDPVILQELSAHLKPTPLFIADGHHRYETALTYRRRRRQEAGAQAPGSFQPYDAVLMLFAALEDPGLTVLPTHRVLRSPLPPVADIRQRLAPAFSIEELTFTSVTEPEVRRRFLSALRSRGQGEQIFGLTIKATPAYYLLALRPGHGPKPDASPRARLDVSVLQDQVLSKILTSKEDEEALLYTKDDQEALGWVRAGSAEAALLLNPTKVSEVRAVAACGERMPHKSTYFFPKPLTGLVMNVFDE
jgi:uncharacterized protein (DUF1015 family)